MKIILFLFLLLSFNAYSQDTTKYSANLTSTGSINKTFNSNTSLFENNLNLGVKSRDFMLNSTSDWAYGRQSGQLTNNDFSSTIVTDIYTKNHHVFYWALATFNTSYSLKIVNQFIGGAGIAYNFVYTKHVRVNLSEGVVYDEANLRNPILDYQILRNSLRFSYHFHYDNLSLDGSNYLQNAFSDYHNYIIKSNTAFSIKLQKYISFVTALNYNDFTVNHHENLLLTYGLTLSKEF